MLIGDKGKTGKLSLRNFYDFLNPVSRDTYDNLTVTTDTDLGSVLVVIVGCDGSWLEDQWYVSAVTVVNLQSKEIDQFPCHHWIGGDSFVSITTHTSKLIIQPNKVYLLVNFFSYQKRRC